MEYKTYVNRRDGLIKNGGCMMKFHGILLAYIYAIVGSDDAVILVKCSPFIREKTKEKLRKILIDVMIKEENDRNFYWDYIDSPIDNRG